MLGSGIVLLLALSCSSNNNVPGNTGDAAGAGSGGTTAAGGDGGSGAASAQSGTAGAFGATGGSGGAAPDVGGAGGTLGDGGVGNAGGCTAASDCPAITTRPEGCALAECTDGECVYVAVDADGDREATRRCQSLSPGSIVALGLDCDDADATVNPAGWDGPASGDLADGCNDALDNDCSGAIDDGMTEAGATCTCAPGETAPCSQTSSGLPVEFPVLDDAGLPVGACQLGSKTCLPNGTWGACTGVIPPQAETCDGSDNDCDDIPSPEDADTPKQTFVCDADRDNHLPSSGAITASACAPPAAGCAGQWLEESGAAGDDCDDADPGTYTGASEVCDDTDNDCDGTVDDNASDMLIWSYDADSDFYRRAEFAAIEQCYAPTAAPENCASLQTSCPVDGWHGGGGPLPPGDCNDNSAARNPSAVRDLCDGTDYDCDGSTLTGCSCTAGDTRTCGTHAEDGVGVCKAGTQSCIGGAWGDCLGSVGPSAELCGTADHDCDGVIGNNDESAVDKSSYYCDNDADGVLAPNDAATISCLVPTATCSGAWRKDPDAADFNDCRDTDNAIYPGAAERCNRLDDNCDKSAGRTSPVAEPSEDADNDGYAGLSAACTGGTLPKTDCFDGDARVHPGQTTRYTDGYCPTSTYPTWCGADGFRRCYAGSCSVLPNTGVAANYDFDCDGAASALDRFQLGGTTGNWGYPCTNGGQVTDPNTCASKVNPPEYVSSDPYTCGANGTHTGCGVTASSGGYYMCGLVTTSKLVACR